MREPRLTPEGGGHKLLRKDSEIPANYEILFKDGNAKPPWNFTLFEGVCSRAEYMHLFLALA
jgi:hypothetical protein